MGFFRAKRATKPLKSGVTCACTCTMYTRTATDQVGKNGTDVKQHCSWLFLAKGTNKYSSNCGPGAQYPVSDDRQTAPRVRVLTAPEPQTAAANLKDKAPAAQRCCSPGQKVTELPMPAPISGIGIHIRNNTLAAWKKCR